MKKTYHFSDGYKWSSKELTEFEILMIEYKHGKLTEVSFA